MALGSNSTRKVMITYPACAGNPRFHSSVAVICFRAVEGDAPAMPTDQIQYEPALRQLDFFPQWAIIQRELDLTRLVAEYKPFSNRLLSRRPIPIVFSTG